jgi:hypothetical protein
MITMLNCLQFMGILLCGWISRVDNSDIYGCDISRLLNTKEELSTGDEGKEGTEKESENGICLGTFFIALILLWGIHQIQKPNKW